MPMNVLDILVCHGARASTTAAMCTGVWGNNRCVGAARCTISDSEIAGRPVGLVFFLDR